MNLIEALHQNDTRFSLAITGGGTSAIGELLAVPGASATLFDARVPYDHRSLAQLLGFDPAQACSQETARAMAMQAHLQASTLAGAPVTGLGFTAALTTNRERRGMDRCHIAIQSAVSTLAASYTLDGSADRATQEQICTRIIVQAMAFEAGLETELVPQPDHYQLQAAQDDWRDLLAGTLPHTWRGPAPAAILPGAFNPLHQGHRRMKSVAEVRLGKEVVFELSTYNVDKPPLDFIAMSERQAGLAGEPFMFSRAPTFLEKSRLFPGVTFVVGADTLTRIGDSKYYGHSTDRRDAALRTLAEREHRFLVFGRTLDAGFQGLSDLTIPPALRGLCDPVPEAEFREDISSTQLRQRATRTAE